MIISFALADKFMYGAACSLFITSKWIRTFYETVFVVHHKHLKPNQIKALVKDQIKRTNVSDAAIIALAGYCYCSKLELSLLNVEDLLTEKGKLKKKVVIPQRITGDTHNRYFLIGKTGILVDILHMVIEWRLTNKFDVLTNSGLFGGLQPESRLLKKPKGADFTYKVSEKGALIPFTITNYLNRVNDDQGIKVVQLNNSFVVNTWNALKKAGIAKEDIVKTLVNMTGLTTKTLREKVVFGDEDIQRVAQKMFSQVRPNNAG